MSAEAFRSDYMDTHGMGDELHHVALILVRHLTGKEVRDENNDRDDPGKSPVLNVRGPGLRDLAPRRQDLVPVNCREI